MRLDPRVAEQAVHRNSCAPNAPAHTAAITASSPGISRSA
jgi:hypothetical protein